MIRSICTCLILMMAFIGCAGCANNPAPIAGINEAAFGSSDYRLFPWVFAKGDAVPDEVRSDLAELSAAIQRLHESGAIKKPSWNISPGGRGIALVENSFWHDPPTSGVWVWPDWQDAERVLHFEQFSAADFVSDWAIRLKQFNRHALCHFRAPESLVEFGREDFTDMYADESGRWLGLKHGRIHSGMLDGPDALKRGKELELEHGVGSFSVVQDGRVMVTSSWNGKLQTYLIGGKDETAIVDSIASTNYGFVARNGVIGKAESDTCWIAIDEDAHITVHRLGWIGGLGSERPASLSPNGCWIKTWEDGWAPGMLSSNWRRVPGAPKTPKPKVKWFRGWVTYR